VAGRGRLGWVPEARDAWRKSSFSGNESACVEVALGREQIRARDSKDRAGPMLVFSPPAWSEFVAALVCGELERS
jgi:hypothetical protein